MRGVMGILLALMLTGQAWAAIDTWQFKDEAQEQAFREITSQLRCPKCQNNSIADSNAMIAADMRQKVYELMQQGKTKGQIVDYMVARYGHFVSYEPPLTAGTVLLWLGPGLFVLAGAGVIIARARRRDHCGGKHTNAEHAANHNYHRRERCGDAVREQKKRIPCCHDNDIGGAPLRRRRDAPAPHRHRGAKRHHRDLPDNEPRRERRGVDEYEDGKRNARVKPSRRQCALHVRHLLMHDTDAATLPSFRR